MSRDIHEQLTAGKISVRHIQLSERSGEFIAVDFIGNSQCTIRTRINLPRLMIEFSKR